MSAHTHRAHGPQRVVCAIITVSDTRTEAEDRSGQRMRALLEAAGHEVGAYRLVPDEPAAIHDALDALPPSVQAVLCNGGTGLARRDRTYEAIIARLDKEISGFGELFRLLSYEEIGAAAMLSRATAGVMGERVVFSLPGSTAAVELAVSKLILPELGHMVGLLEA